MIKRLASLLTRTTVCAISQLVVGCVALSGSAHATSPCFTVFDATVYSRKPDMRPFGVEPVTLFDVLRWWAPGESHDELTRSTAPEAWVRAQLNHARPLVLDLEAWPTRGDPALIGATMDRLKAIVVRLKRAGYSGAIGYYGLPPNRDYWRATKAPTSPEYRAWQRENDMLAPIVENVDAIYPSLYTFYDGVAGWKAYAVANLTEARRLSAGKPVYAFLWPQYHNSNLKLSGQFLPADYWKTELETAAQYADGVVIWGGWGDGAPLPWNDNAPWWTVTKAFVGELSVRCKNNPDPMPPTDVAVQ